MRSSHWGLLLSPKLKSWRDSQAARLAMAPCLQSHCHPNPQPAHPRLAASLLLCLSLLQLVLPSVGVHQCKERSSTSPWGSLAQLYFCPSPDEGKLSSTDATSLFLPLSSSFGHTCHTSGEVQEGGWAFYVRERFLGKMGDEERNLAPVDSQEIFSHLQGMKPLLVPIPT